MQEVGTINKHGQKLIVYTFHFNSLIPIIMINFMFVTLHFTSIHRGSGANIIIIIVIISIVVH